MGCLNRSSKPVLFMRYLPFGLFILYAAILILLAGIKDRAAHDRSAPSVQAGTDQASILAFK
jgi:hypothetical protein